MNESIRISEKLRSKIAHLLMDNELFEDKVQLLDFEDENVILKTAYMKGRSSENIYAVYNLPTLSDNCLLR